MSVDVDKERGQGLIQVSDTISGIIASHPDKSPELIKTLSMAGLQCAGCSSSSEESLLQGAVGHGLGKEKLDHLVKELNQVLVSEEEVPSVVLFEGDFQLTVTPEGAKHIELLRKEKGTPDSHLRLAVAEGGCSGHAYDMQFVLSPRKHDRIIHQQGLTIYVDGNSLQHLHQIQIDHQGQNFTYDNPNAQGDCGCGQSFDLGLPFLR